MKNDRWIKEIGLEKYKFSESTLWEISNYYKQEKKKNPGIKLLNKEEFNRASKWSHQHIPNVCFLFKDIEGNYAGICYKDPIEGSVIFHSRKEQKYFPRFRSFSNFMMYIEYENLHSNFFTGLNEIESYDYPSRYCQDWEQEKDWREIEKLWNLREKSKDKFWHKQILYTICLMMPENKLYYLYDLLESEEPEMQIFICQIFAFWWYEKAICVMEKLVRQSLNKEVRDNIAMLIRRMKTRRRITREVCSEGRYIKQCSSIMHYAVIKLKLEPIEGEGLEIEIAADTSLVKPEFILKIKEALTEAVKGGKETEYPVIGIKATIIRIDTHPTDSMNYDFAIAAMIAWKNGTKDMIWKICEP